MKCIILFLVVMNLSCVSTSSFSKKDSIEDGTSHLIKNKKKYRVDRLFYEGKLRAPQSAQYNLRDIEKTLNISGLKCPNKIWPRFSWKNKNAIIVLDGKDKAYMWSSKYKKFNEVDYHSLSSKVTYNDYADVEFNGVQTATSLKYLEDSYSVTADTLFHEAFHFWGQENDWSEEVQDVDRRLRGTYFPLEYEPRELRAMIYHRLKEYLISKNEDDLSKAAFWYKKWKKAYPKEANKIFDRVEGSAQYVRYMYKAIGKLGCDADIEKIFSEISSVYEKIIEIPGVGVDIEGYELGALSGFILDSKRINWKEKVIKTQLSSLEILLNEADEVEDIKVESLINEIRGYVDYFQNMYNPIFKGLDQKFNNPKNIKIYISSDWEAGARSTLMVVPKNIPSTYAAAFVEESNYKNKSNNSYYLRLRSKVPVVEFPFADTSPCKQGYGGFYIIVEESEFDKLKVKGKSISYSGLNGELLGEINSIETDPKLGQIYCLY